MTSSSSAKRGLCGANVAAEPLHGLLLEVDSRAIGHLLNLHSTNIECSNAHSVDNWPLWERQQPSRARWGAYFGNIQQLLAIAAHDMKSMYGKDSNLRRINLCVQIGIRQGVREDFSKPIWQSQ